MISRIPGKAFLLVALFLCVPAAWLLGNNQSNELLRGQLERYRTSAEQEQMRLQSMIDELKSDLQQQKLTLDIAEARAASLQVALDERLKQSNDDMAELALYRRIEGVESERGIRVDEMSRMSSRPDVLSITLVQARGRDRASGAIGVTLLSRQNGFDQRWILTDSERGLLVEAPSPNKERDNLQTDELLSSSLSDDIVKVSSFDLRFFQTLLVKVENITTINPEYVEIWILPDGKRLKPQVQRFRWLEIDLDR